MATTSAPPTSVSPTSSYKGDTAHAMRIDGVIKCVGQIEPVAGATLWVRARDVTRADSSAVTLAEQEIHDVTIAGPDDVVPFTLQLSPPDPRGSYTIEAHLDANHSGDVSVGDLLTTEHISIDPSRNNQSLTVSLRQVT